ncbi:MAG: hypothetical protein P1U41_10760 [Vicingaceae bacterium]|nr:hypothetical protein [Vicingaceae bacterium]
MNKNLLLTILLIIFGLSSYAQSDNQTGNPELQITEEGKRLEATLICLDALEAPTKYNEFAKQFITLPNFPQKSLSLSSEDLRKNINQYFINHPKMIDNVRDERKKAHDKIYGSRPY